ncbi:DUF6973 domain-containing protein [Spirosoma endbachense]|uniref:DUF6973 domain-containing protein n=1 Tax=Spirosoma endbachense TaxID=2666025 RepID=A0A6P1W0X1_9BACT|nr:hypothetical protein [Spirosoma endbachense]QHV98238.1 hypothetical protein GJR95_25975 [Spirosoma endbachense]
MNTFIKKYYVPVLQVFLLTMALVAWPNTGWAERPPYRDRLSTDRVRFLHKPNPHPVNTDRPGKKTFDSDPIRFSLTVNKRHVKPGEVVDVEITAHYLAILSSQLFVLPGANAFRLKLLLPDGFVQTGGDYTDYIGTELSSANPTITYKLKGYFARASSRVEFRLLRGSAQANESTLFVEKTRLVLEVDGSQAARQAGDYANLSVDCGGNTLTVSAQLTTSTNNRVSILIFKDNAIVNNLNDLVGPSINQTVSMSGSGSYYAKVREVNNDGNEINSSVVSANCFGGGTPNPPTNPNPPTSGCNFSQGQHLVTTSWGEAIYAHQANGYWFAAYQDGSNFKPRHWLEAISYGQASCFAEEDPRNGTPSNPNPPTNPTPPTSGCNYSAGQFLLNFYGEAIYAHQANGYWYAAYQDGSNFKPRHWLVAAGFDANQSNCFAEEDPRNGGARPQYDLDEVTVTAFRDYNGDAFAQIYTLYVGNDYRATSNPAFGYSEEYSGLNASDLPAILEALLTRLNLELRNQGLESFNDAEMAILRTLSVRQVFNIYTSIVSANNLANVALNNQFKGEAIDNGYSNAFRHFYFAFGIARATDANIAARFVAAHESTQGNGLSTQMDTNNNEYALYIYRNNLAGTNYVSFNFLLGLAQNGQLWTIQNGVLGKFPYIIPGGPRTPQN